MRKKDYIELSLDLCSRLMSRVKVSLVYKDTPLDGTLCAIFPEENGRVIINNLSQPISPGDSRWGEFYIEEHQVRPYLRRLSDMTEEEKIEFHDIIVRASDCSFDRSESASVKVHDWYLSRYFDTRGLIPRDLAKDAKDKEIYKRII